MASGEELPSPSELRRLLSEGWTMRGIADEYGSSLQAVYNKTSIARIVKEFSVRSENEFMPWKPMRPAHQSSKTARMLRMDQRLKSQEEGIAHALLSSGNSAAQDAMRSLVEPLRRLECNDFVISYHFDTPSNRFEPDGGFFIRPRRSGDLPGIMQLPSSSEQPPSKEMLGQWHESWRKKHLA